MWEDKSTIRALLETVIVNVTVNSGASRKGETNVLFVLTSGQQLFIVINTETAFAFMGLYCSIYC